MEQPKKLPLWKADSVTKPRPHSVRTERMHWIKPADVLNMPIANAVCALVRDFVERCAMSNSLIYDGSLDSYKHMNMETVQRQEQGANVSETLVQNERYVLGSCFRSERPGQPTRENFLRMTNYGAVTPEDFDHIQSYGCGSSRIIQRNEEFWRAMATLVYARFSVDMIVTYCTKNNMEEKVMECWRFYAKNEHVFRDVHTVTETRPWLFQIEIKISPDMLRPTDAKPNDLFVLSNRLNPDNYLLPMRLTRNPLSDTDAGVVVTDSAFGGRIFMRHVLIAMKPDQVLWGYDFLALLPGLGHEPLSEAIALCLSARLTHDPAFVEQYLSLLLNSTETLIERTCGKHLTLEARILVAAAFRVRFPANQQPLLMSEKHLISQFHRSMFVSEIVHTVICGADDNLILPSQLAISAAVAKVQPASSSEPNEVWKAVIDRFQNVISIVAQPLELGVRFLLKDGILYMDPAEFAFPRPEQIAVELMTVILPMFFANGNSECLANILAPLFATKRPREEDENALSRPSEPAPSGKRYAAVMRVGLELIPE